MRLRLPAVLATLVVLTALTTGVSAGPVSAESNGTDAPVDTVSPVVPAGNTTSYLALPNGQQNSQQQRFGTADIDVAGAAAVQSSQFSIRLFRRTTIESFRAAPNATAQTRVLRNAAAALENRSESLEDQQSAALRAYNDGRISTRTVLRRLAVVDARADRLETAINRLLEDVNTEPGYTLPTELRVRIQNARTEPLVFQGPVRATIQASMFGEGPRQMYIGSTDESIVLARISGGRYVREAFVADAYGDRGPDQFRNSDQYPVAAARDRVESLYSWGFENRINTRRSRGLGLTPVYRFAIDHTHGRLDVFVDGRTNETFREIQQKELSRLPIERTATRETGNLTLRLNLTHPTGPMEVSVHDPDLNETVDAAVTVGGERVGRTGDDGSLWTVRPNGLTVINVSTADHSTELTVGV